MESELKDLNSKPPNYNDNANSVFDDHLLLKLEPPASADSIAEMEKKYAAVMCTTPWDATSFRKRRSSSSAFHWSLSSPFDSFSPSPYCSSIT
ncbi:hypothetical protein GYH30_018541 [Glycine max]|nr:hypothetical protein GYH30_018541 [Glycine max]